MGLINKLLKRKADVMEATLYTGNETLDVVGEASYQDNLWRIVGGTHEVSVRKEVHAVLLPEPNNKYDPNAIRVIVNGLLVGYLARTHAVMYLPGLRQLMSKSTNSVVALNGAIVGGEGRKLGIFLEHDPIDFGITPRAEHEATSAGFRTGFSEASITDVDDDSYDLSWFSTLSSNESKAIKQLRDMLRTDPDPIDRHYMFCELECKLYKNREAFASALSEFDEVCKQHDGEMDKICPALLTKFGRLPILDLYKQSAIRHQKAKDFTSALWWARRGIEIYGQDAGVAGVVDDLRKRCDVAQAKIDVANKPKKTTKPKVTSISLENAADGQMERQNVIE